MKFKIEKISYEKLDILLEMYREKAEWLNKIGQPMWDIKFLEKNAFIKKYDNPECFIAYFDQTPIGGFILVRSNDFFWGENSHIGAYYINKIVVKNGYTGQGIAEKILDWIEAYAKEAGKEKLRLDCYEDRKYLLHLYKSCGYKLIEVKTMPDGIKIAQFEKIIKQ